MPSMQTKLDPIINNRKINTIFRSRETGVFLVLILMCTFMAIMSPSFIRSRNLLNIGRQGSTIGIMAVGMTFILIVKEIDLSVGAIYAITGMGTGMLLLAGWNVWLAIGAGLLIGAVCGLINGLLSTFGRIPSFIATLGMSSTIRGIALLMTQGNPVTINERSGVDPEVLNAFYFIGQGKLFGTFPMQFVFFILTILVGGFLLSKTTFGFKIYASGGSEKASIIAGVNVNRIKIFAFVFMGVLAGISGILGMSFLPSGQAGRTGLGMELDVIAAVVIGGTSMSGGEGTVLGTLIGVFIMGVLKNGLVLLGISSFWQETIMGLVIILAVGIDKWTKAGKNSFKLKRSKR
ncbi:MAG: ABC transporter permease [Flexilinea sp.]